MKLSKRLIIFVGLLCVITLAIPTHVFCQAEGAAGAGAAGTGAAGAGAEAGGAAAAGVGWGTIALSVGMVAAVAAIGIAASGGGGTTTTNH